MSDYSEIIERTIKYIEAQIEDADYKGEKFRKSQLEKQLKDLLKGKRKQKSPGDSL